MAQNNVKRNKKWAKLQIENFKEIRPRFVKYAEVLGKVLSEAAKKYAPLAIVQTRPKALTSFAEKIQRKNKSYKDAIKDMTDLCGGRVITHTQAHVDAMCRFIEANFEIDWENSENVSRRLKYSEFGYLSVHYIVLFKTGVFPSREVDAEIPKPVMGLKAEIQVRTLLQHAWADITHDLSYKSEIKLPDKWNREFAALAAVLEDADKAFCRIESGLKAYQASYGAYMSEADMRQEIDKLEFVRKYDQFNPDLAGKIGKMAIILGNWDKAISVLSEALEAKSRDVKLDLPELIKCYPHYQPLLRDLGIALCKQNRDFRKGQEYLTIAADEYFKDSDAVASLAGSYKGKDEGKARDLYRKAYEISPSDPYPLLNYLSCEIMHQKDLSLVKLLSPVIKDAIQTCNEHIEVGMNLPWAYYNLGELYLLLNEPYESVASYAKAVLFSSAEFMIETSLNSLERLDKISKKLSGYEWARQALLIALLARFSGKINQTALNKYKAQLQELSTIKRHNKSKIKAPVVILAGGCDSAVEDELFGYCGVLLEAFKNYQGTLISGGTASGVSGLAGMLQEKIGNKIYTVGYLPEGKLPNGAIKDERYSDYRQSIDKKEFSPLEPLQAWIDIMASGISPAEVKVLGINGGNIAAIEYRLALAFGATVAVVEESGREAGKLPLDPDWSKLDQFHCLSGNAKILSSFIMK